MNRAHSLLASESRALPTAAIEILKGKTILITGASGLIGTHLVASLVELRLKGRLDVEILAAVRAEPPKHLSEIAALGGVEFVVGDLTIQKHLDALPFADYIIHAATYAQPARFTANAIATLQLSTVTLFALFNRLVPEGRLLFLSSSELYSGLTSQALSESEIGTTTPSHSRACYIEGKRCGEAICNAFRQKGVRAQSARVSLVYGPGANLGDKRVLNNFIEKGLTAKQISLLDSGDARRTYCYISDAMAMLWRIMLEGSQPVYNVGGTSTITIADLARLVGSQIGVPVRFPDRTTTSLVGAPQDVRVDISRFCTEFERPDFVDIRTGVSKTIEWTRALVSDLCRETPSVSPNDDPFR